LSRTTVPILVNSLSVVGIAFLTNFKTNIKLTIVVLLAKYQYLLEKQNFQNYHEML